MVYYIEVNLIAIIVAIMLLHFGQSVSSREESSMIIVNRMLQFLILLSVSDIAAYCFRGRSYVGVQISNVVYFIAMAMGAFEWFIYILVKTGYASGLSKTIRKTCAPVVIMSTTFLLNPLTGFYFTVDSSNLYHRGPGILVTWVVEWGYFLAAFVINVIAVRKETRNYRRSELRGYLVFALPVAVAAACQMLFYGTTTTQVGFTIAMLLMYINMQNHQAQRDELTGLNNKNAYLHYLDSFVGMSSPQELTVFVADADSFKAINDTYGHMQGDQALRDIANALKAAAGSLPQNRVLLFRYGGDEFLIVGVKMLPEQVRQLQELVEEKLAEINSRNRENGVPYTVAISLGYAEDACGNLADFERLMKKADEDMYRKKLARKGRMSR